MLRVRGYKIDRAAPPLSRDEFWTVFTHTHTLRNERIAGSVPEHIVAMCRAHDVDALGIGSPYTEASLARYKEYEGPSRALYYSGAIDQRELRPFAEITALLEQLRVASDGGPEFYLDNETPKGRYGHLWWFGWTCDFPPWHDYDQDFDRWMVGMPAPGHHQDEPMPYARRSYLQILAAQREAGGLGIWAHPTSWWYSGTGAFQTNIATELPFHLFAQGEVDGMVVVGYNAYSPSYLRLWYALLDSGHTVPGFAEMDSALSMHVYSKRPCRLNYVPRMSPDRLADLQRAAAAGDVVASSGPLLRLTVDGVPAGSVALSQSGPRKTCRITAAPAPGESTIGVLRLVSNVGSELWRIHGFAGGAVDIEVSLDELGESESRYLIAQAFGEGTDPETTPAEEIERFATTNPLYLRPNRGAGPQAMTTTVEMTCRSTSPWLGGTATVLSARGEELFDRALSRITTFEAPADSVVQLATPDGYAVKRQLLSLNEAAIDLQRYLYRGRFTRDYANASPRDVPVDAFRLEEVRAALAHCRITL